MNEAKELLSKLLIAFQNKTVWQDHDYCSELVEECRRFLRKPEPDNHQVTLEPYDAGLLGDGGGGNVAWWHDYIRAELDRAHDFYQDQAGFAYPPAQTTLTEQEILDCSEKTWHKFDLDNDVNFKGLVNIGPWKINNGGGMTFIEEDATDISICRVSANNQIANANLIAAAPDLLEALKLVIADLELRAETDSRGHRVLNILKGVLLRPGKAIDKANGEHQ